MAFWYSVCPVCEEGRLFVTKSNGPEKLFLLCEECESAWRSPEDIDPNTHFNFGGGRVFRAERADIYDAGWFRYPLTETA
jgi:hypothetical protein